MIRSVRVFLFFAVVLITGRAQAQVYPVQGNSVLIPPYSVYLADYTNGATDRLILNLVLNDITRPELKVRLRAKIIGQNITLETKPEYIGKELVLQGGIPLRITGSELTEYFNPNNLNFSGISRREFDKTGALPAGFYQFCFEVLEYNRGVKISNSICANGWLILNDPPIINLPRNGEKLTPTQPQNIVFQWTPRHTGSPNSAFSTEYDIKLVELWPVNRNPNDAILTSPPILETTTRSTTFIYDVSQTPLEPGRHYALQVKAKSIVGADELDLFRNNGKSEVITFVYGDACNVPQNILAEASSATRFTVKWTGDFNHTGYSLRYRVADNPTAQWYTSTTLGPDAGVSALQPNTTYEFQVAGGCGVFESAYSGVGRIKTLDTSEQGYACGMPLEQFNLDPASLLDALKVGDVIQAGDFDVKIAKVSGSDGTFAGEGVIEVPFFNKAKVKAEFSGVVVNKEMRMVSGYMNVTGAGVDVIPSGVLNFSDQLSETLSALDTALATIEDNLPKPFDEHAFVADTTLTLPGPVVVDKDENGNVIITDAHGVEHRLPNGTEVGVVDDQGNGTLIDSQGKAHSVSASVATAAANREYNLALTFTEAPTSKYGFDAVTNKSPDALKSRYRDNVLDGKYYAPYKSIETGATDFVVGALEDGSIDRSKIRFEMGGVPVPSTPFNGDESTITVSSKSDGEEQALIAVLPGATEKDKDQVLGRVNVVTYEQISKVLHIVPVNGNEYKFGTAESLQRELNRIYGHAIVNWSVTIEPGIQVEAINPFDVGQTSLLTNYTDHMKKVISAYKTAASIHQDESNFYLFLVNAPSDPAVAGYMPRSKQFGFIFYDHHGNEPSIARTMAHELGHGAFNLHHTFMEENFSLPKNSTDNLMDYAEGTKLYKYQWDMMRSTPIVMGLFEGDEEAESQSPLDACQINIKDLATHIKQAKSSGERLFKIDLKKYLFACLSAMSVQDIKYIITGDIDLSKNIGTFDVVVGSIMFKDHVLTNNFAIPKTIRVGNTDIRLKINKIFNGEIDINTLTVLKVIGEHHITYSVRFNDAIGTESFELELYELDHLIIFLKYLGYDGDMYRQRISDEIIAYLKSHASDCDVVDVVLEKFPLDLVKSKFTYQEKLNYLKTLANCAIDEFGSNEENAVLTLIRSIQKENSKELIAALTGNLTESLDKRMNGENNLLFAIEISKHVIYARPPTDQNYYDVSKIRSTLTGSGKGFRYNLIFPIRNRFLEKDDRYTVYYSNSKLVVEVSSDLWFDESKITIPEEIDPFSYVSINMDQSVATELGLPHDIELVPAIFFRALSLRQNFSDFKKGIRTGVDVGLFLAGGFSVATARTLLGRSFAYADLVLPAVDIAASLTDFRGDPNYNDFVEVYDAVYTCYATASVIAISSSIFKVKALNALEFWDINKAKVSLTSAQKNQIDDAFNKVRGELNLAKVDANWIDDLVQLLPSGAKSKITSWINEGLDVSKLENAFNSVSDKFNLYSKLNLSKGLNHQRTIIDDYEHIPGVTKGNFSPNAVDNITTNISKSVGGKSFTINLYQSKTFAKNSILSLNGSIEVIEDLGNGIQLIKVKPGTKMYRVFDGYKPWDDITMTGNTLPNGSFWTFEKPNLVSEVIEGTAVMPEWNAMTKIIEIEVPSTGLYGWYGKAARQPASSTTTSFYLKGGQEQVIVNFSQNQQSISSIATSITSSPWIK